MFTVELYARIRRAVMIEAVSGLLGTTSWPIQTYDLKVEGVSEILCAGP